MKYSLNKSYRILCIIFIMTLLMIGCKTATKTLILSDVKFPATIEPTEDIKILKIDKKMVKVYSLNSNGTQYYKIALEPGEHTIVVHLPMFNEGSVFFLKAFVIGGREYLIKYKVGDRTSYLSREWKTFVWVEDASTGKVASSVIKNI